METDIAKVSDLPIGMLAVLILLIRCMKLSSLSLTTIHTYWVSVNQTIRRCMILMMFS